MYSAVVARRRRNMLSCTHEHSIGAVGLSMESGDTNIPIEATQRQIQFPSI